MQVELNQTYCTYQAQSRLLELGVEVAEAKNWKRPDIQKKIDLGIKIRLYLKALSYSTYLEKEVIDRLVYVLADLADVNSLPYAPVVTTVEAPSILVGIPIPGEEGEQGPEGGGVPFSYEDITTDTVVDSFACTVARGVEYTLNIYDDSGSDMRIMRIQGGWSSDGSVYDDDGGFGTTIQGDCSGISFDIRVVGGVVQLFAAVTSGTWVVEGTRKYVPNNGNGIVNPTSLIDGKIWIGNSSDSPTARTLSGDVTVDNTGVTAISSGVIVNGDVSSSAAIAVSKLAALTASRAIVSDSDGFLTASAVTATELGYVSGVTSNIQTQLDSKLSAANGAISTVVASNLTADRAVISNPSGKIAVSSVTSTELGYVSGTTSNVQTQLDAKVNSVGTTLYTRVLDIGDWNMDSTSSVFIDLAALGIDYTTIRSVSIIIRVDSGVALQGMYSLLGDNSGNPNGAFSLFGPMPISTMGLFRDDTSIFNSTDFDSTGYNRGWVTIIYTA